MKVLLSLCLAALASATKISELKESIQQNAAAHLMAQLGTVGPFKVIESNIIAKVSKVSKPVTLSHAQQRGAWTPVEGNAMIEAWAVSENGLIVKQKEGVAQCATKKGQDNKNDVSISFTCMLESGMQLHAPLWPIKTGYDALHDQKPLHSAKYDDQDESDIWDPRVRFWHRCAGGKNNGLSMCNRYRFVGADSAGYYGCDYMTEDSYCVQSYRHEWVEFNPNDLPFAFNPESPCQKKPCVQRQ